MSMPPTADETRARFEERVTVLFPKPLSEEVKCAAATECQTVSEWLRAAARERLKAHGWRGLSGGAAE